MDLAPDADFVFVHNSQPTGNIDVLEKELGTPNRLPDLLPGGWMDL